MSDRRGAPAEERAKAFSTYLAYAGRYAFTGDKVIHHIEGATFQNWVGTDQVRLILKIDKNRMAMRVAGPLVWDEVRFAYQDLVW